MGKDKELEMEEVTYFDMEEKEFNKQFKFLTHHFVKNSVNYYDAENLAMESLEKAMRTYDSSKSELGTHIYNVRNSMLIDFTRNKQYKQQQITTSLFVSCDDDGDDERNMDVPDSTHNADVLMDKKILYKVLEIYINKLKPLEKDMIMDRYFEDLSYDEIIKKHNISSGTMRVTLKRAKEKLKKTLSRNKGFVDLI